MKIKTIISAVLISAICCMSAASADSVPVSGTAEDGICFCLSGNVNMYDFGYEETQIRNRLPYSPLQLGFSISDPETNEVLYVNQTTADDDGAYNINFILSAENGTYNLKIYTAYCKIYEGEFEYCDGVVAKLNEKAESGDSDGIEEFISAYAKYMSLDLSLFKQFTDEERGGVIENIIKKAPFASKEDIRKSFSEAVFTAGLTTVTLTDEEKTEMLNEHIESLGGEYASIGEFIKSNELEIAVIEYFNDGDYDTVKDGIYELSLKAFLKNSIENIYDLEELFNDNLFSIPENSMTNYQNLTNKTTFFTTLNNRAAYINTLEDFYDAVDKSIANANKAAATSSPAGSAGGSTGGGGGGGSTKKYSVPMIAATPTPAPTATPVPSSGTDNDSSESVLFTDLDSYGWAEAEIYELANIGAIAGDGNGNFLPGKNITREEFVKIIANAFSVSGNDETESVFDDVKETDWFYAPVMACFSNKITNGISDTQFGVGLSITRQEAAALLSRILAVSQEEIQGERFADDESIAEYAKNGVYTLKTSGIINGYDDNTFRPESLLTRAEAAKMIYSAIQFDKEV